MKKFILLTLILCLALSIVGCSGNSDAPKETANGSSNESTDNQNAKTDEPVTVKIGVVGTNEEEVWKFVKEKLVDENINLEIVVFTEYSQPNPALTNGDLSLNAFQHYNFLDHYNEENNQDLKVIGETIIAPLGLYSQKIKDVSEIEDGDDIAIPNDATNEGRALLLLQSAGLITVDPTKEDALTLNDITDNPKNLNIFELDASQTARSLVDVKAAIINGGMAADAGLSPSKDAIFLEKLTKSSKPYINVVAARADDVDNPVYQTIMDAFRADDTAEVITEVTNGANIAVWKLTE